MNGWEFAPETVTAVFAPLYPPAFRGGGPIRSIEVLVNTAPPSISPIVLTSDRDLGSSGPLPVVSNQWTRQGNVDVYYATVRSVRHFLRAVRELRRRRPHLLHFNSIMNPSLTIAPLLLWRVGYFGRALPLLSPRGELGDGALSRRALKKRVYLAIFRLSRIPQSVIWHSTATHETADIRRIWGEDALIVQREEDTLLPAQASPPVRSHDGPIRAVFVGRMVEHKGLAIALEALKGVTASVDLAVYGIAEDDAYLARCKKLASTLPSHVRVAFLGAVPPADVPTLLNEQDVLLMPTAGENFGHVIAEALSASCVVVTTPFTPWTDEIRAGGGVVVDDRSVRSWSIAIEKLAREHCDERHSHRIMAGETYNRWAARPKKPHVWTLAMEASQAGRKV